MREKRCKQTYIYRYPNDSNNYLNTGLYTQIIPTIPILHQPVWAFCLLPHMGFPYGIAQQHPNDPWNFSQSIKCNPLNHPIITFIILQSQPPRVFHPHLGSPTCNKWADFVWCHLAGTSVVRTVPPPADVVLWVSTSIVPETRLLIGFNAFEPILTYQSKMDSM